MCDIDVAITATEQFDNPDDAIDILEALLIADQNEEETETIQSDISDKKEGHVSSMQKKKKSDRESLIHNGDTDSSDDEDNRNCFDEKYNDFGKRIKHILSEKDHVLKENTCLRDKTSVSMKPVWKSPGNAVGIKSNQVSTKSSNTQKVDVYTDPVFGIRMVKPLISSTELKGRMVGRTAISIARVKYHIQHGDTSTDWVIGGVIVRKSPVLTSQKGSPYCIWRVSDLREGLKTVSVFLFRNSHKNLWKTAVGTVIGILNPSVLENRNDKEDEATISVDNAQKVMILGMSKDLGTCRSRKKNGDSCTAFVNTNKCEFCVYHIQQEYKKCSKRSELQSPSMIGLRNKVLGKNEVFYGGQSFTAIPAKVNRKQVAKDNGVLQRLSEGFKSLPLTQTRLTTDCKISSSVLKTNRPAVNQFDGSRKQTHKDQARLRSLISNDEIVQQSDILQDGRNKLVATTPILRPDVGKAAVIDLSAPIKTFHIDRAKINAVQWVQHNGPFHREDPNSIKAVRTEGLKRSLEGDTDVTGSANKLPKMNLKPCEMADSSKRVSTLSRFQQLMETKSRHTQLLEARDEQSQEEYFNTLEKKEKMEEKMLNTYKVACKAVRCVKCKYTSFSASDMCKTLGHPLKVMDAVKRFFRCRDCGNRTVSLELIPLLTCKQCGGSQWQRAPMMRERKGSNLHVDVLSIRGGEEKFIGSTNAGGNLNLLVPE